jgi:hypothetical protein
MKIELKSPLKVYKINQRFGNKNPIYNDIGGYHNGIDFYAPFGTPVYATHDGFASYQIDAGGGHGVVIISDKEYEHEKGTSLIKTIYWHLVDSLKYPQYKSPFADKTGFTPVKTGDLIGYADNTGRSTGSHLHFALKPVAKGEDWGTYYNLESGAPYYGAIDPEPYLPKIHTGTIFFINLHYGSKGSEVSHLQGVLKALGYYNDVIDGKYGKNTKTAVLAFQMAYKVISYPIESLYGYYFGPKTRDALNNLR